jgi:hypothetical protein
MADFDFHALSGPPRPLKPGEKHCIYCSGYGYNPRPRDYNYTGPKAIRCTNCDGSGLEKK